MVLLSIVALMQVGQVMNEGIHDFATVVIVYCWLGVAVRGCFLVTCWWSDHD